MCNKIMFNIIRLEFSNLFTFNTYSFTRGHPYKLYVIHSRINVRKHFFACPVVNVWNSLPLDSDYFRSLHCFRSSLNNIDFSKFLIIEYYVNCALRVLCVLCLYVFMLLFHSAFSLCLLDSFKCLFSYSFTIQQPQLLSCT